MPCEKPKTSTSGIGSKITLSKGPPPECGDALLEREIPSDSALVTPLVIRAVEFLRNEHLIRAEDESKVGLCLEEVLQNAVKHGNKSDFKKKVRFRVFLGETEWGVMVSDEGAGFELSRLRDPLQSEGLWGESGRGLYLISHYMDRVDYFNGGSTVVLASKL
jgi:serine/threonine-protein kinase RsbW